MKHPPLPALLSKPTHTLVSRRVLLAAAGGSALWLGCGPNLAPTLVPIPLLPLEGDEGDDMPDPSCDLPYYDALVLYGSALVNAGASAGPNTAALANPHGLPMELLSVKFRVYPQNDTSNDFQCVTGMSVGVKFDLGAYAICDSKVTIDSFGNARDDADEATPIDNAIAIYPNPADDTIFATPFSYTWRLKYPLLIPAGAVLTPVFEHLGQNPFPVTVDIIYTCRNLPPSYKAPETVMVPWVSSFSSDSFDNVAATAAASQLSNELDIINQFATPLEISRLSGRCSLVGAGSSDPTVGVNFAKEWYGDHRFRLMKLRIRGSRGDEIARVPTPFNGLFPMGWRSWDIPGGWIMRPGEFYKVQLSVDAVDYLPQDSDVGRVQVAITAIGYRPANTRELTVQALEATQP